MNASRALAKTAGETLKAGAGATAAGAGATAAGAGEKRPKHSASPQKTYGLKIVHHNFQQGELS